ncbi:D(1) dopamine receptor-like [Ptychodera flava]|uniref:D(1) dopamine receptor-like n=1 Tax=Ptychodera flava TaxID=63121 RepID=UPI00396A8D21
MDVNGSNCTEPGPEDLPSLGYQIGVGIVLYFITLITILGNILVISSVVSIRRLQTVTNYFIVSLAVADTTIAVMVMPFAAANEVLGYWAFGAVFCEVFNCLDVLCCTASIINLCMISVDRYLAITSPFTYHQRMTAKTAAVMIATTYVVSALISVVPVLIGWYEDERYRELYDDPTFCALLLNPTYALISSIVSFYIPMVIILFVYARIYCVARKHQQRIHAQETTVNRLQVSSPPATKRKFSYARERKAAKTLGIIVGVFILCWLPFFIVNVVDPYCFGCVPVTLFKTFIWLGYVNSGINPLIYAFNSDFRKAFKSMLRCHKCRGISERDSSFEASNLKTVNDRKASISHISSGQMNHDTPKRTMDLEDVVENNHNSQNQS